MQVGAQGLTATTCGSGGVRLEVRPTDQASLLQTPGTRRAAATGTERATGSARSRDCQPAPVAVSALRCTQPLHPPYPPPPIEKGRTAGRFRRRRNHADRTGGGLSNSPTRVRVMGALGSPYVGPPRWLTCSREAARRAARCSRARCVRASTGAGRPRRSAFTCIARPRSELGSPYRMRRRATRESPRRAQPSVAGSSNTWGQPVRSSGGPVRPCYAQPRWHWALSRSSWATWLKSARWYDVSPRSRTPVFHPRAAQLLSH